MNPHEPPCPRVPPKLADLARPAWTAARAIPVALLGLGGAAVLFHFDPTKNWFYPQCMFHRLTGLNCPGCGATRAAYALVHGQLLAALHDNALFLVTGVVLGARICWCEWRRRTRRPVGSTVPPNALIVWMVAAMVFGVLRNLPAFAFLSP